MATHSSILAWRIPWTEEPGELQSVGWQRIGHDWSNLARMHKQVPLMEVGDATFEQSVSGFSKLNSAGLTGLQMAPPRPPEVGIPTPEAVPADSLTW